MLGLAPGTALAAYPAIDDAPGAVSPGTKATIVFDPGSAPRCALRFHGPGGRAAGPYRRRIRGGFQSVRWRVPSSVAGGHWRARVGCPQDGRRQWATIRFRVPDGRGSSAVAAAGSVRWRNLRVRGAPRAGPAPRYEPDAGGTGGNPFPPGQCTFHAYERRADIYETAVAAGISREGWDAYAWAPRARQAGFPVGAIPVAGSLAVFPREYYGGPRRDGHGAPFGHVGYVVRVLANGSFRMSERNWGGNPAITTHTYRPGRGIEFVYGGPAGKGPGHRASAAGGLGVRQLLPD